MGQITKKPAVEWITLAMQTKENMKLSQPPEGTTY